MFVVDGEPGLFYSSKDGVKVGRAFVGVRIDYGGRGRELLNFDTLVEVTMVDVVSGVKVVSSKLRSVSAAASDQFVGAPLGLGNGGVELGGSEGSGGSVGKENGVETEGQGIGGEVGKASKGAGAVSKFGGVEDAFSEVGIVVVEGNGNVEAGVLVRLASWCGPSDDALSEVF